MTDNNPYGVAKDQIWESCDKRDHGRRVMVLEVGETKATVISPTGLPPKSQIRLDRFRPISSGYRRIS